MEYLQKGKELIRICKEGQAFARVGDDIDVFSFELIIGDSLEIGIGPEGPEVTCSVSRRPTSHPYVGIWGHADGNVLQVKKRR